jgi:hypothetical protein
MSDASIEELMLELSFDGVRKGRNLIEFYSPDRITSTLLILNEDFNTFTLETKLFHSFNQIQGSVYTLSEELFTIQEKHSEDTVREIIEDIATQVKYVLLPKIYDTLEKFELKESMDHESTFFYQIDYKDKEYSELKQEIYNAIDHSFKLILKIQEQIATFIEKNIKKYIENPEIESKVLEIKKRLFQVQFYSSMTGRFSNVQKRKAKVIYKEAMDLHENFKKQYPEEAKKRKKFLEMLFDKYKP